MRQALLLLLQLLLLWCTCSSAGRISASQDLVTINVTNVALTKPAGLASSQEGSRAQSVSLLSQDKRIKLFLTLKSKNLAGLDVRAAAVIDPSSNQYQQYLTPQQFGRSFGASSQAISVVKSYLQSKGLTVAVQPNRLCVEALGTAAQISQAFNTKLVVVPRQIGASSTQQSSTSSSLKRMRAPISHPKLPASIAERVAAIHGLDNFAAVSPSDFGGFTGTGANNKNRRALLHAPGANDYYLTVDRVRKLYNLPTEAFSGQGQTLAVAAYEKYDIFDVEEFAVANGLIEEGDSLNNIVETFVTDPDEVSDANPQPTLVNLEMLLAAAPKAKINVYLAENSEAGEVALLTKIANLNTASVVLYTWGRPEHKNDVNSTINTLLKQMALQGQAVVVASGSCGSSPELQDGTCVVDETGVNFPASSGYVTAVGGTTPTLYFGDLWAKEVAWESSGGGVSSAISIPDYQKQVATLVDRQYRNLPDVALAADPDKWPYEIWVPNEAEEFLTTGGTAAAASIWAGYVVLVNQCRKLQALKPARLGAANGPLYQIGLTPGHADKAFRPCIQGSNGAYTAGTGWDAVTGWGSMDGQNLMGLLCPGYVSDCLAFASDKLAIMPGILGKKLLSATNMHDSSNSAWYGIVQAEKVKQQHEGYLE